MPVSSTATRFRCFARPEGGVQQGELCQSEEPHGRRGWAVPETGTPRETATVHTVAAFVNEAWDARPANFLFVYIYIYVCLTSPWIKSGGWKKPPFPSLSWLLLM